MSANASHPLRKTVNWLSRRVPPIRSPFFAIAFAALLLSLALWILPLVPELVLNDRFWAPIIHRAGLGHGLIWVFYGLEATLGVVALCFFARCIELCWPEYFDPFQDKHF